MDGPVTEGPGSDQMQFPRSSAGGAIESSLGESPWEWQLLGSLNNTNQKGDGRIMSLCSFGALWAPLMGTGQASQIRRNMEGQGLWALFPSKTLACRVIPRKINLPSRGKSTGF